MEPGEPPLKLMTQSSALGLPPPMMSTFDAATALGKPPAINSLIEPHLTPGGMFRKAVISLVSKKSAELGIVLLTL